MDQVREVRWLEDARRCLKTRVVEQLELQRHRAELLAACDEEKFWRLSVVLHKCEVVEEGAHERSMHATIQVQFIVFLQPQMYRKSTSARNLPLSNLMPIRKCQLLIWMRFTPTLSSHNTVILSHQGCRNGRRKPRSSQGSWNPPTRMVNKGRQQHMCL